METWEPVNSDVMYVKPSSLKINDAIEGTFLETTTDETYDTLKHHLRQEDGSVKIINGSGQLNHVMKAIAPGTKIRVVYKGKKKLESGKFKGKDANQWQVLKAKKSEPQLFSDAVEFETTGDVPF